MDAKTLAAATGIPLARAQKWEGPISEAITYADITLARSIASFLAQTGHESMSFTRTKEMGDDKYLSQYDTGKKAERLGNTPEADGDGQLYAGRGLIQVTGKSNYRQCSLDLFGDERLVDHPQLLEEPRYAALSAAWYWKKKKLNSLSNDIMAQTQRINGGLNGIEDRKKRMSLALKALAA
ncbi:endolysin [Pseudomonas phage Lana]|uniref:Lysozyme n=1 Tax=Pseudomonas phage Lana TaxID=2530172 RepID=A0A481W7S9_9CAUD|nr:endolysin [Pseudomonas phage Lana]QBJ04549.1 lysozyme [Pseudomonas phage Lana]